jgi:uncharacterized protein with PQ loop repeat
MSDTNPSSSSAGYDWHNAGVYFGNFATVCFTLQYIPQAIKNYKRQSVQGFSTSGIIMKLLGAAFLTINAYILGEAPPVILYGLFNVIQHSIFVVQFAIYNKNLAFLPWILFPVFPFWLATTYPQTIGKWFFLKIVFFDRIENSVYKFNQTNCSSTESFSAALGLH